MLKVCKAALIVPAASLAILMVSNEAFSQNRPRAPRRYRGVSNEPYVSPYLNLVRPGADPGFNYYTLVQPQVQQEDFNLQQGRQMFGLGRQIQQTQAEIMTPYGPRNTIRPTGRVATRMNYSHYYPNMGGGPSGGGRKFTSGGGGGGMGGGMGGMGMGGMGMY
ncbi:MAG TPA: hypothetical protein VMV10_15870 [Pirellulales bacterium]|nr:hypothetical protein [Pirellulales bacterium]